MRAKGCGSRKALWRRALRVVLRFYARDNGRQLRVRCGESGVVWFVVLELGEGGVSDGLLGPCVRLGCWAVSTARLFGSRLVAARGGGEVCTYWFQSCSACLHWRVWSCRHGEWYCLVVRAAIGSVTLVDVETCLMSRNYWLSVVCGCCTDVAYERRYGNVVLILRH